MLVSQLNRNADSNSIPKLSDLRDSGELEQSATTVILMHDAMDKKNTEAYLPEAIEYLQSKGYEFRVLN